MMYRIITFLMLILILGVSTQLAKAQSDNKIEFGLKAGLNLNKLSASSSDWESEDMRIGIATGAFLRVNFEKFFIQPELLISQKGGNLQAPSDIGLQSFSRSITSLDVPLLVGVRFLKYARINVGPLLMFPVGGKQSENDEEGTYAEAIKNSVAGYQAGIGLDISRLRLDLRYERNISKLGDDMPNGTPTNDKISTYQFTIGYRLF